ncbi:N-acetylmuramoyl-L-alanine amidase [Streptomyces sp. NPDC059506]|uniref:N-acetylmuramoyl-L-alanine amidase n=1 Tax=Streptomyces sp. NPDC059506 TaxID=3347751 RepID=UPI003688797A
MPSEEPRRGAGRSAVIAVCVLVPAAFAGWLVWAGNGPPSPGPAPSAASPAGSAPEGGDGKSGDGKGGDGKGGGKGPHAKTLPLAGRVVVLDPGHNPGNFRHTSEINRRVDVGTHRKECDTTGTSTDDGYAEAAFTLDVSRRARELLERQGATVRLTQDGDRPWGPCIDERARIGNKADADAVVSVHADGSGSGNRGFHVILPAKVRAGGADTTAITGPSRRLGESVKENFARSTGSPVSNYLGEGTGLTVRRDLGGLNLSTVPKVFVECGNMRDARDAALLKDPAWRQDAARGIADGVTDFLS